MAALLVVHVVAPAAAAGGDSEVVCETVAGRREPVCLPRELSDIARQINVAVGTTMAFANMAPDFCQDVKELPQSDCKRATGTNQMVCTPRPDFDAYATAARAAAIDELPLHLVFLAVLRQPGTGAAATLLGGVAMPNDATTWGLRTLERALEDDLRVGDVRAVVNDLLMLAAVHIRSGDIVNADRRLADAGQRANEGEARAAVLANVGVVAALRGDYARAIDQTGKAVDLYRGVHQGNLSRGVNIAGSCKTTVALNDARRALAAKSVRTGLEAALINLGSIHAQLGQFEQAIALLRQSIALHGPSARGAGAGQLAMAAAAQRARHTEDVKTWVDAAARSAPSLLLTMGSTYSAGVGLRRGASATGPGGAVVAAAATTQPTAPDSRSAAIDRQHGAPAAAPPPGQRKAALLAEAKGTADALRAALANLQQAANAQQQPELGIYYGKRAVNEIQRQRANLSVLPRDVRKSFAASSRRVYEALVEALLAKGRLAEAEHAMHLLHQDDLSEFSSTHGAMPLNAAERAMQARDTVLAERWRAAALQREAALTANPALRIVSSPDQIDRQFDMLVSMAEAMGQLLAFSTAAGAQARTAMDIEATLKSLECHGADMDPRLGALRAKALAAMQGATTGSAAQGGRPAAAPRIKRDAVVEVKCSHSEQAAAEELAREPDERLLANLRNAPGPFSADDQLLMDLRKNALSTQAPQGTAAALHYLITDRRLFVLVVTSKDRAVEHADVGRAALEDQVEQFRKLIQDPIHLVFAAPAISAAQALYGALIAPVANVLKMKRISLLHLALDGKLRYLPVAALHDGQHWLIESFAVAVGSPSAAPSSSVGQPWRMAGFGVTKASAHFKALPAVEAELHGLVKDPARPAQGVMPGIVRLDKAFTANALRDALAQPYPVVHIATHFRLSPDGSGDSFLMLGEGVPLTLLTIRDAFRFDGVALVTLSACDTGMDTSNSYGQEFEGLSAILRSQGAASVMATLWPVDDGSTSRFMRRFYSEHQQGQLTRAQALRAAQLAFIRRPTVSAPASASVPAPEAPAPSSLSHPFFWAPFVLFGDAS